MGGIFSFEDFLLGKSSDSRFGHITISETELKDALENSGFSIQSFEVGRRLPRCLVRAVKGDYSFKEE